MFSRKFLILIILAVFIVGVSVGAASAQKVTLTPKYDEYVNKSVGEYTVQTMKWKGTTVGGFGVWLYKNGQLVDKDDYASRAYFCMDGKWKWSDWDNGEDQATYHKYPVSTGVEIKEVEVEFKA